MTLKQLFRNVFWQAQGCTVRKIIKKNDDCSRNRIAHYYKTDFGEMLHSSIEDALANAPLKNLKGKINLILTSPPFPLVRKKRYGNETGKAYVDWLCSLSNGLTELLTEDGSVIIEIGNAWEAGIPTMSTLPLEALLAFKEASGLHLCQHIICHNPARLPGPAAWVTLRRIRLKDSYTHVWWLSKTPYPKSDNRKVLNPYSKDMQRLLKTQKYNAGMRPSGHVISETGFLKNHGGAIGPNVLDTTGIHYPESLLKFTGTKWDAEYREFCKDNGLPSHPARMQSALAAFFIQFLTDEGDLVFDPFGGSNTTGSVAEEMHRRWVCVEANADYIEGSRGRFKFFKDS
ncbi:site-specific DNA-methyltransferase [Desulfovibrio sp. UIB00]|nr:site-specific DNA-methyltransferase [Desulfovibrio sp. UIB00]